MAEIAQASISICNDEISDRHNSSNDGIEQNLLFVESFQHCLVTDRRRTQKPK